LRSAKQKPPSAQAAAYREGSTALHDAKLKQFDLVPFDPAVADTAATWRSRELREVDATSASCELVEVASVAIKVLVERRSRGIHVL